MIVKNHLDKASRYILVFLRVFGLWPSKNPSLIYTFYGQLIVLIFSLLYTLSMIIQLLNIEDMKNSTEALYMTLTEIALVIKILNYMFRVIEMQKILHSTEQFSLETDAEQILLQLYVDRYLKIIIFYYIAVLYASTNADVISALGHNNDLPYSAWYPYFDWKNNNRHFWILFVYQAIGMFITAMVNVSLELYAAMLMIMNSFQMEVLGMRLRKLGYTNENVDRNPRFSIAELSDVNSNLIKYAKLHQSIAG